jgi:hypothetical protein
MGFSGPTFSRRDFTRGFLSVGIGASLGAGLAGCDRAPTFDASSLVSYRASLGEIMARLSPKEQRRLEVALLTLAFGNAAPTSALLATPPENLTSIVYFDRVANPLIYLDRIRYAINGRSADAVIALAAADLDTEIARNGTHSADAERLLNAISVTQPRYSVDRRSKQPIIEFSVFNGSKDVIQGIYVAGTITTGGHGEKWLVGGMSYRFPTPLVPGEQAPVQVVPRFTNADIKKALASVYDAEVTLKVTNIEGATGGRLLSADADVLEGMRNRRNILRGS